MPESLHRKKHDQVSLAETELIARIIDGGPVTVSEYMEIAAGHYYATAKPFGAEGDFTTAPEISQMFGEMIGAWLVDTWMQSGKPDTVQLIELGPGKGTLMADIMRSVSAWPEFKSAVSVHLVETSPILRQEQAAALKSIRPTWYENIEEIPEGLSLVVANEFFDALPVHQFRKTKGAWLERRIDYDTEEESFVFTTAPASLDITTVMPESFLQAPDGCIFEISPVSLGIAEKIARRIEKNGGAALIVDYGHSVTGLGDTLQSLRRHQYTDVLQSPGTQDITAHVDFGLVSSAVSGHVSIHGPVGQGPFLLSLGIAERAARLSASATGNQKKDIASALRRLTASDEMGALFKVVSFTQKNSGLHPAGFGYDVSDNDAF